MNKGAGDMFLTWSRMIEESRVAVGVDGLGEGDRDASREVEGLGVTLDMVGVLGCGQ